MADEHAVRNRTEYIKECMSGYEENGNFDRILWEYFTEDFADWTEEQFRIFGNPIVRWLRDFLRSRGVWVYIDRGRERITMAAALAATLAETEPTKWTEEEIRDRYLDENFTSPKVLRWIKSGFEKNSAFITKSEASSDSAPTTKPQVFVNSPSAIGSSTTKFPPATEASLVTGPPHTTSPPPVTSPPPATSPPPVTSPSPVTKLSTATGPQPATKPESATEPVTDPATINEPALIMETAPAATSTGATTLIPEAGPAAHISPAAIAATPGSKDEEYSERKDAEGAIWNGTTGHNDIHKASEATWHEGLSRGKSHKGIHRASLHEAVKPGAPAHGSFSHQDFLGFFAGKSIKVFLQLYVKIHYHSLHGLTPKNRDGIG